MSEFEHRVFFPTPRDATRRRPDLARLSELDLLFALAEKRDLLASLLALLPEGDDIGDLGDLVNEVCGTVTDIEDELMRRGFTDQILCS
jgi:hypothetical protein